MSVIYPLKYNILFRGGHRQPKFSKGLTVETDKNFEDMTDLAT